MKTSRSFQSEHAFMSWASSLGFTPETTAFIQKLREGGPARRPKGRANVKGFYSSTKMRETVAFESHTNEFPTIMEFEYDPEVWEYYSQTGQLKLVYPDLTGRNTGCLYTPDLFRITPTGAGWVECKIEEKLVELSKQMPHRYILQEDGSWRSPPAEAAARELGLTYEIRTRVDPAKKILARNLNYVDDYFRRDFPQPEQKKVAAVHSAVKEHQGISFADLVRQLENTVSIDEITYMISRGLVHANLSRTLLIEQHKLQLFSDSSAALMYDAASLVKLPTAADLCPVHIAPTAKVVIGGSVHTIIDADVNSVSLLSENTTERSYYKRLDFERLAACKKILGFAPPDSIAANVQRRMAEAGPEALEIAVSRWQIIQPYLSARHGKKLRRLTRTERRWLTNYRKSEEMFGNGFIALIPKARAGNSEPKLADEVKELMMDFIINILESKVSPTATHAHGQFQIACEKKGLICPSLNTFLAHAKLRPVEERVSSTLGPRAGKKLRKFIYFLERTSPVHGDRPWEIVHIDHTQLDIELICSATGQNLGRPWFTLMVDAFTRRILAISVSFSSPSTLRPMM